MNIFDVVKIEEVAYVYIERKLTDSSGSSALEYFVWLKPKNLQLKGYKFKQNIEEAHNNLEELYKANVLCNYNITQLHDSDVLVALSCKESAASAVLGENSIVEIELEYPNNNIHHILYEIVNNKCAIKIEGAPGFSSGKNLAFNTDNYDILWRFFDEELGFRTYHACRNGIVPSMIIHSPVKLNVPYLMEKPIDQGFFKYEYILNATHCCNVMPVLKLNGEPIPNNLAIVALGMECLLLTSTRYFQADVTYKTVEALNQYINGSLPPKFSNSSASRMSKPVKTCTITSTLSQVTTAEIKRALESSEFNLGDSDSLDRLIVTLSRHYDQNCLTEIITTLMPYLEVPQSEIGTVLKLETQKLSQLRTLRGIEFMSLKEVFGKGEIFNNMYSSIIGKVSSSMVEGCTIQILTYLSEEVMALRYAQAHMLGGNL